MSDKGFWEGTTLEEDVNGKVGFIVPCWLIEVEFELLGGSD